MIDITEILNELYKEAKKPGVNIRMVLVKAFMSGCKYQEEKIRKGIDIVFENLNDD